MSDDKKCSPPKTGGEYDWNIDGLKDHLQAAVDLEFWTIPFYMSALYSIKNPTTFAYQLIQSVVYQEMFHVTLAANIGNAYGLNVTFKTPSYEGTTIPHLDFSDDEPDPTEVFSPYSAEIGPLDIARINSMCLIEYPEWRTGHEPCFKKDITEYGSIGEFYMAVELGAAELVRYLKRDINQVDIFDNYYNNLAQTTITRKGTEGLKQVVNLVTGITDQGEGQRQGDADIPPKYQNTTDDIRPAWTHFKKFNAIRLAPEFPKTYEITTECQAGIDAQGILIENFAGFLTTLEQMFSGQNPEVFGKQMATLGGNILNCWKNGIAPKFS